MMIETAPRRRKSDFIIGASPPIKKVLDQISVAGSTTVPVCLLGESGTGKELVARTIHATGSRADGPFLSIHCGVIPDVLLEGELFGFPEENPLARFTRGAGLLAEAAGGTIFLDQVEAIPRKLQSRLMSVLTGLEPMGAGDPQAPPPRLITASAKEIGQSGRESGMDPELARSLRAFTIVLPPLRERGDDIQLLAAYFLRTYAQETRSGLRGFTPEALNRTREYPWPGNVREIENKVRQAVLLAQGEVITADDLFLPQVAGPELVTSFKDAKRQFEKQYISQVLRASHGNISRAARLAQKDRKDFYDVMRRNGIDPRAFRGRSGPDS